MNGNISPNKRLEVWNKTGGVCWYCSSPLTIGKPEKTGNAFIDYHEARRVFSVDHVTPQCAGGSDDINNLVPCCSGCNNEKRHRTLEEYRRYMEWEDIGEFTRKQIYWLEDHGIQIPQPKHYQFYFEYMGWTL